MLGFWKTFDSPLYLVAGVIGIVLGILIAHLANVLRQPAIVLAGLTVVVVYFLLGGAIALREDSLGGILPTPPAVTGLSQLAVGGWKDLVHDPSTRQHHRPPRCHWSLPLAAPAARSPSRWLAGSGPPGFPPPPLGLLTASVILLGTRSAGGAIPVGLGSLGLGCAGWWCAPAAEWCNWRRRIATDDRPGLGPVPRSWRLLQVSRSPAREQCQALGAKERFVLRTIIEPPFRPGGLRQSSRRLPSLHRGAKTLWDQPLLTVTGLPEGSRLRFATLDDYNGTVWSAQRPTSGCDGDRRLSAGSGRSLTNPGKGDSATYAVTVSNGIRRPERSQSLAACFRRCVPRGLRGRHEVRHLDGFRYDLAASQGMAPDRLRAGDKIDITGTRVAVGGETLQLTSGSLTAAGRFCAAGNQMERWAD